MCTQGKCICKNTLIEHTLRLLLYYKQKHSLVVEIHKLCPLLWPTIYCSSPLTLRLPVQMPQSKTSCRIVLNYKRKGS